MYGAILGDIIGSRFEFDRVGWTKEFELFNEDTVFTDDTVMSVAVAEALVNCKEDDEKVIKNNLIRYMQKWGRKYPGAGYGYNFYHWVFSHNPRPYNSWGNGSAMRVSSIGWLYPTLEKTLEVAKWSAEVSHNHPEGIKGAQCTAAIIYLARTGKDKEYIRSYVINNYGYDFNTTVAELTKKHRHDESCMDSLPKALVAFFEGVSFEDVIRNAVCLGGDTDTIAAIAGSMAEAYFGIPDDLLNECINRVDDEMKIVLEQFVCFKK